MSEEKETFFDAQEEEEKQQLEQTIEDLKSELEQSKKELQGQLNRPRTEQASQTLPSLEEKQAQEFRKLVDLLQGQTSPEAITKLLTSQKSAQEKQKELSKLRLEVAGLQAQLKKKPPTEPSQPKAEPINP